MSNFYGATSLIGSASGALDAIDGADLADLDGAHVVSDNKAYHYWLDDNSAGTESSPLIIAADANGGDKRWLLTEMVMAGAEIITNAANAVLTISCYHNTEATTPLITLRKADGTLAAPALVDDNAVLGTIHFDGHDGSGWHTGAKIEARIQGSPSDGTDMPTEITFWTCPEDSATLAQRMTILADGKVGVGILVPNYVFEVVPAANRSFAVMTNDLRLARTGGGYSIRLVHEATAIIEGGILGYIRGCGNENAAGEVVSASIEFVAHGDWTNNTDCPSRIEFWTTPSGSAVKVKRVIINDTGNVGFNTETPDAQIEISKNAINTTLTISSYHDTEATTPLFTLRKAEGTEASHATCIDDNAVLGTIHFDGYDGSGWHTGAKIEARIDGTPSDGTDMPTEITFWTCPEDSATLAQRMTIKPDGGIYFSALKSGTDQSDAGAVENELYVDTNDDNTVKLGAAV